MIRNELRRKELLPKYSTQKIREFGSQTATNLLVLEARQAAKGLGFIAPPNGGSDAFVHISTVERSGLSDLREGEKLTFELVAGQAHGKDVCGADKDPRLSPTYRPEWKAGRAAAALSRRAGYAAFQITNSPLSSK